MKYFIDTNIFLRVLTSDNKIQSEKCVEFLQRVKNNKIEAVTATVVLAEVTWTLLSHYKLPKGEVVEAVNSIIHLSEISIIDSYDHSYALKIFGEQNIKFIDALVASLDGVKEKHVTVVSYDRDFDKLGVLRKEPGSILKK